MCIHSFVTSTNHAFNTKRSITQPGRNLCERRRTTRFASRNRYYQNAESIKFKSRYATRCGGQGWVVIDPVGVACIFQMFGLPRCGTLNWKHIAGSAAYMDHRWNEAMATRRPVIREPSISPIPATSIMRCEPKDFSYVATLRFGTINILRPTPTPLVGWKMENLFRSFVCESTLWSLKYFCVFVESSLRVTHRLRNESWILAIWIHLLRSYIDIRRILNSHGVWSFIQ